jgi:hypothetical protein
MLGSLFARCTRCGAACGVMPFADARAGGWLAVLDHACGCGASVDELASATEEEIRHATQAVPRWGWCRTAGRAASTSAL